MPPEWMKAYYDRYLFPEMQGGKQLVDRTQAACIVGHFCEQYMLHTFGGALHDDVSGRIEPDIVWWSAEELGYDLVVEVKGCGRCYGCYVSHDQVRRYKELMETMFPLTNAKVYYAFVVHGIKGITKRYNTEWALAEGLGSNLLGVALLPLEIVSSLLEWLPQKKRTQRGIQ